LTHKNIVIVIVVAPGPIEHFLKTTDPMVENSIKNDDLTFFYIFVCDFMCRQYEASQLGQGCKKSAGTADQCRREANKEAS